LAGEDETEEALEELTRFMVPLVSHDPGDPPNVAILLHELVDLLGHRRWAWLLRDIRNKGTTGTSGLLLRVVSPEDAVRSSVLGEFCASLVLKTFP
jgi:hypothetical protein